MKNQIKKCPEEKYVFEVLDVHKDITKMKKALKKLLILMDGYTLEMLVKLDLMDLFKLLIESKTFSNYLKVSISPLKKYKEFTQVSKELLIVLFMVTQINLIWLQ